MRIVSLLPSATEILFAIGAGDDVVAVTHECDFPKAARKLPAITSSVFDHDGKSCADIDRHIKHALHAGSSIYKLDERLLAQLDPDLIVTQELCEVCAVAYKDVGHAVRAIDSSASIVSLEPTSIDDILETVLLVGERTSHRMQSQAVVSRLRSRLAAVAALPSSMPKPRMACIEWTDPLMVAGQWVPEMVRLAGAEDPLGRAYEPSRWVEPSEIAAAAADIIVLMPCGFDLEETTRIGRQLLAEGSGKSWLNGAAVVAVDGSSYFNRPGPRIVDGLELLADLARDTVDSASGQARWLRRTPALA
jgi:iron complex transport system substrate-binding protein